VRAGAPIASNDSFPLVRLYHTNANSIVEEILADGFPVSTPEAGGVHLTDRPPAGADVRNGQSSILFNIAEEEIRPYEFDRLGSNAREFAVPAEVLNRHPIMAVRQDRQPALGPGPSPPAPSRERTPQRRRWIAIGGLVVLVAAAGAYALVSATGGGDEGNRRASKPTPARHAKSGGTAAPAPPTSPSGRRTGSVAVGTPEHGRLVRGVPFPAAGPNHFTWDAVNDSSPNPQSRRYATDYVVRSLLRALRRYRKKNPGAPKVGIGDLSGRGGGSLPPNQGHQNGLDVAVLYPRSDGSETEPANVQQVNVTLAEALLAQLHRAGATRVSLDPRIGLTVPDGMRQTATQEPRMQVGFPRRRR
jgi:hypothetical protein